MIDLKDDKGYRVEKIFETLPSEIFENAAIRVLDIGSRDNIFGWLKTVTLDVVEDANIKQDLNENQKLPFKDNSFDLVVVNQVLEHLCYVEEIVEEIKRVSRKYVFVGLPNELCYGSRIKFLFGIPNKDGYQKYGHKHFFRYKSMELFIKKFFGKYKKRVVFFAGSGAALMPKFLKNFLAYLYPSLFGTEFYYLIELKK